jgi:hypothetical protein
MGDKNRDGKIVSCYKDKIENKKIEYKEKK